MIAIDLNKQEALDADPKAIQQINFTGNLNRQNEEGQNINDNTKNCKKLFQIFHKELLKYSECDPQFYLVLI